MSKKSSTFAPLFGRRMCVTPAYMRIKAKKETF